jgi:hypothetical protein
MKMSQQHRWNDNGSLKANYSEKHVSQCRFFQNEFLVDWLRIETGLPRRDASD